MAKAKAARIFHAARRRRILRRGVTITISFDCDATALAFAMLGNAARQAAAAFAGLGDAMARADAIDGHCVRLEPGQLFARQPDGQLQHLGATGPIRLRLGHDPLPGQVIGCTCTVTRMVKTDSRGQPVQVDVPGPTCDWCLDLEGRAAAEGFGLVLPEYCGTCGEPIEADDMTGTTCACARAGQA